MSVSPQPSLFDVPEIVSFGAMIDQRTWIADKTLRENWVCPFLNNSVCLGVQLSRRSKDSPAVIAPFLNVRVENPYDKCSQVIRITYTTQQGKIVKTIKGIPTTNNPEFRDTHLSMFPSLSFIEDVFNTSEILTIGPWKISLKTAKAMYKAYMHMWLHKNRI